MKWPDLLRALPGYDPYAQADGCWFDESAAQLAIDFIEECLRHIEGDLAGQPFLLQPWQKAIVANLFGWWRTDTQGRTVRRYRQALIYVARGNGKTPLAAAIGLYIFFCDPEIAQQGYLAAGDREQASFVFRWMHGFVEAEPELSKRCRVYGGNAAGGQSRSIVRESDTSFLRVISADGKTKHGGTTNQAIVDELHVQPNRELVDVLETSMGKANRKQPLLLFLTTADYARESICNEKYEYACKVRDGVIPDQTFLPAIFEAARDDDWTAPETWAKANPNLGVSVSAEDLGRLCTKAREIPTFENTFKRLHCNIITEQAVRAIPMDRWRAGGDDNPALWRQSMLETLRGQRCCAGLDLGATADLTALVLLFPPNPDRKLYPFSFLLLPWFWAPRENAIRRARRDRVPYLTWAADQSTGLTLTEGDVTDYDKVRCDIVQIASDFQIVELAVDRLFQGAQLCTQLMGDNLEVVAFGQGFTSMAAPCRRFLELILDGKLHHGGNPILTWMASNACTEQDAAGNTKWSKKKSTEKIDGIVAATMALARAEQADLSEPEIVLL